MVIFSYVFVFLVILTGLSDVFTSASVHFSFLFFFLTYFRRASVVTTGTCRNLLILTRFLDTIPHIIGAWKWLSAYFYFCLCVFTRICGNDRCVSRSVLSLIFTGFFDMFPYIIGACIHSLFIFIFSCVFDTYLSLYIDICITNIIIFHSFVCAKMHASVLVNVSPKKLT
jgi:hypothetical protein